ncbi:Glycosyl transferase, family 8 [Dillenia turbinata]|uniref:Hexosyltransferase n=1 Tax=Dillenia turbinata TaxID=194707 RepID=A0AAN8V295_9MAGN
MRFYISANGVKKLTIGGCGDSAVVGSGGKWLVEAMKGKGSSTAQNRRLSYRTFLPAVLFLGILLPFLFLRIAFLVLESATLCSSSLDCIGWRFFGGGDPSLLRSELTRALTEAKDAGGSGSGSEGGTGTGTEGSSSSSSSSSNPTSFNDLVRDVMASNRPDLRAFAFKTKAMLLKMEHNVQLARRHASIFWHLASHGVPKSLHCLCLKLAEEYAVNAMARSRLPPPEFVSRLADPSFHHLVLLTDNVLAASVVISSTITNSANPEKLVFHVVTDKKTYTPMHAWFAINSIKSAVIEVKGLHQFDWSHKVNVAVKEMLEIHNMIWSHHYKNFKKEDLDFEGDHEKQLGALRSSSVSLLNHLRIYLPELFPELDKIVFLDDDVVVQHDLSPLWQLDLNGKVLGAVSNSWCGDAEKDDRCPNRMYKDYLNFSNPEILPKFNYDQCGWLYGMNVFDLHAWREANITATYHYWLRRNLNSGLALWLPGALPPALIAFEGHVHPIDPSWHVAQLGYQPPAFCRDTLEAARVIHFSGPAKPWLEIGFHEVRGLWTRHVNFSNEFIKKCRIMG